MKTLLIAALAASTICTAGASHASERLSTHDVRSFINEFTTALNTSTFASGHSFLSSNLADGAVLKENINHTAPYLNHNLRFNNVGYGWDNTFYNSYRYPYHYGLDRVSLKNTTKWDLIRETQAKKQSIPGYSVNAEIKDIDVPIFSGVAKVNVVLREYGAAYGPYNNYYTNQKVFEISNCNLTLQKARSGAVVMTGMNCNVNDYAGL